MSDAIPSNPADDRNFDAELEYTFGFYSYLKPEILTLTCQLLGISPLAGAAPNGKLPQGINYCELGCGQGATLNVLAAADPSGHYVGVDYNPAQIKNARALAESAGIKNVEFIEASFADLGQRDLPEFDFIALHGIYSWVAKNLRDDIVDFIGKKLKPGGLCYISYNCTIGRGADFAFRQLLQMSLKRSGTPSPEGIGWSLALAEEFATKGARYFSANPSARQRLTDTQNRNPVYVFHEYFNPVWEPFFFHEVAADMAKADMVYVGESAIASNNPDLAIPSSLRGAFELHSGVAEQELLKGIWANQPFRRDIYIKGAPKRLSLDEQVAIFKGLHYGLAHPREECQLRVQVPAGTANLPDNPFTTLLNVLEKAPVSGERLRQCLPPGAVGDRDFIRAMIVLFGAEYAELRTSPAALPEMTHRFDQLNAGIARCVGQGLNFFMAATPKNGLAVLMNEIPYFLYRANLSSRENRITEAYRLLQASGRYARQRGRKLEDRKAIEAAFGEAERNFIQKILPKLG